MTLSYNDSSSLPFIVRRFIFTLEITILFDIHFHCGLTFFYKFTYDQIKYNMPIATMVIANILKLDLKLQCNLLGSKINVRIFLYKD